MSEAALTSSPFAAGSRPTAPAIATWGLMVLAVAIRIVAPIDANICWLITNCRRLLEGATLYRDIVETNPPMAIFIYLPATLAERLTGVAAEAVFAGMVLVLGFAVALQLAARLQQVEPRRRWTLPALIFALLVAPLSAFGEREHVALLLTLPLIGLAILRAGSRPIGLPAIFLAGILGGIAPMIKPHFALGIAAATLALAARRRSLRLVATPEVVIAAGLCLLYAGLVWRFMPAYATEVLPLLVDLYRPMRLPFTDLVFSFYTTVWALAIAALALAVPGRPGAATAVLLAASTGFLLGFVDQGRGWPYHAYPAMALLWIAVLRAGPEPLASGMSYRRTAGIASVLAALAHVANFLGLGYGGGGVVAPIRAAISHPKVMSISFDLTPGHPITTEVGGSWVGTYSSRWITVNADYIAARTSDPERQARLEHWRAHDRAVTNRDLAERRPDIVLVGLGPFDWPGWIARDPETARLMADYVPLARDTLSEKDRLRFEGIEARIRRNLLPAPEPAPADTGASRS